MNLPEPVFTRREWVEGVLVVGFSKYEATHPGDPSAQIRWNVVPIGFPGVPRPDAGLLPANRFFQEIQETLEALGTDENPQLAVIDFANPRLVARYDDNHRRTVSLILIAQKRLKNQGGGLFISNHKLQFDPDQQAFFRMTGFIDMYRTLAEAIEAARLKLVL